MSFEINAFLAKSFPFEDITMIYPPTIGDIAKEPRALIFGKILTKSQEDIWDAINDSEEKESSDPFYRWKLPKDAPTPLQFLIGSAANPDLREMIQEGIQFFTHEEALLLPQGYILFTQDADSVEKIEDLRMLTEDNFFEFQNAIRASMGEKTLDEPNPDEPPKIAEMKAKARRRDRLKKKNAEKEKGGMTFKSTLSALCCMGIGISPLNIEGLSYASVGSLIDTYTNKEKYEQNMRFIAGGADPKKMTIKYWMNEEETN